MTAVDTKFIFQIIDLDRTGYCTTEASLCSFIITVETRNRAIQPMFCRSLIDLQRYADKMDHMRHMLLFL